jgi:hypothetical protein
MENVGNNLRMVFITLSTKEEVQCYLNDNSLLILIETMEDPSVRGNIFNVSENIIVNVNHIVKIFVTE